MYRELVTHLSRTWLGEDPELLALPDGTDGTIEQLQCRLSDWTRDHARQIAEREVRALTDVGEDNRWEQILRKANAADLSWMQEYGLPITPEEEKLADFLFRYSPEKRRQIGVHITEALLHGFLSQSRDRRNRGKARLCYCVGQEALAQEVLKSLQEHGLQAIVQPPQCLSRSGSYAMKHSADHAACLSQEAADALSRAFEESCKAHEAALLDTCGMIGIGQFGEEASVPQPEPGTYVPDAVRRQRLMQLENAKRETESRYLAPSDLSFCKVAFPNLLVGENFPAVFDAFVELNTMESEKYELIQQKMIDALDLCDHIEIRGTNGNQTCLRVQLTGLQDPGKQTKFLNCGGDLNVPHGELFTTPRLTGTNGTLHVKKIYLKGVFFQDLRLQFRDGMISDYSCGGCADEQAGKEYVKEYLLKGHDTLSMGECAIGSNTLAYAISRNMNLMSRMPILLAEKMGPHVAVGDPCFARGEDSPVYNLYDHKEMIARENERTARRNMDKNVYFNVHTDITLAFDELGSLVGVKENGEEITVLRSGRFVLPGTEELNEPLERSV